MRRSRLPARLPAVLAAAAVVLGAVPLAAAPSAPPCGNGTFCAGAASVDMSWHVGSGQGQYGSGGNGLTEDKFDPFHHATKMVPSDGIESRAYAKAIVVQGPDGTKAAYVKTEIYLQQAVLTRRVAELVAGGDPAVQDFFVGGLDGSKIMLGGTHNHSVPMYASTAFGVWAFTDTIDARMFEDTARDIARAIKEADAARRPARVGASVTRFDEVQQNILGPATADDGTPAGFPRDHFDEELTVVRFDAAEAPHEPIAAFVNLGMHPESLATVDMISADFVGKVERLVERGMGRAPGAADGPVVAWSQGSVGDVEPDQSRANPPSAGAEYWHRNFAQAEKLSRIVSAAVLDTWADVARRTPDVAGKFVPLSADAPVKMLDMKFAGPVTNALPTVSNCRTDRPAAPVVGLPDCRRGPNPPEQFGTTLGLLRGAGVPVPDNYGATSYGGVQESLRIHLQALRIGEILLATCPCEPISDMTLNFKSRADAATGNQYLGYEWPCADDGATVRCDFRHAAHRGADWRTVDRTAYLRMRAEIRNDAAGWETDYGTLQGNATPAGGKVYGNFTRAELGADRGYTLPIMVGQANDYIGYIVTYREYSRGDHYRKALTAFGPHTADYVNTRLVAMAAALKGGALPGATLDPVVTPLDDAAMDGKARAVGDLGAGALAASDAALPDDGGSPGKVLAQPAAAVQRFSAATFTWEGGSNWTDNPEVVVQRRGGPAGWRTVATQEGGEVVVTLAYDRWSSAEPALDWVRGGKVYRWTATYEVFDETRFGQYRFVVTGKHRSGRAATPYTAASAPFRVVPWDGLTVGDLQVDAAAGVATFRVAGVEAEADGTPIPGPTTIAPDAVRYPFTYTGGAPFITTRVEEKGDYRYCFTCTLRPWAASGRVLEATVTVVRAATGESERFRAEFDGTRWVARDLALTPGDQVLVAPGAVVDEFDSTNATGAAATA